MFPVSLYFLSEMPTATTLSSHYVFMKFHRHTAGRKIAHPIGEIDTIAFRLRIDLHALKLSPQWWHLKHAEWKQTLN
jgi:hypothetical protein